VTKNTKKHHKTTVLAKEYRFSLNVGIVAIPVMKEEPNFNNFIGNITYDRRAPNTQFLQ
jgi:hypothetical protein